MFMKNELILVVLEDVRNQLFDLSKEFLDLGTDAPYFEDSCKVVNARYKLGRLYDALKLTLEYEH